MKKVLFGPYAYDIKGADYRVDRALKRHFDILNVESTGPMSGSRENVYHLVEYGVTLKHVHNCHWVGIILYGSDEKVGEVERIVMVALSEGLREQEETQSHETNQPCL